MAFERLLRLTKKCPGYVVSRLRNANVGIATVTQKSFESQYYITRALFGTRSLFAMTAPLGSRALRFMLCLQQELKNVQLFVRQCMRQPIKLPFMHNSAQAQALANQIPYMLTSKKRQAQKKKMATKLRRWSYLYLKVVCSTFFLLRFFLNYREIDTVQCKNPFIVTEKYV